MIVTLIPFFLAAFVNVSEKNWKYGPEVIYDVSLNYADYTEPNTVSNTSSRIATKLKCRPKFLSVLNCYFPKPELDVSVVSHVGETQQILSIPFQKKEEIIEDIFELNYGINGLESITVPTTEKPPKLEMIRSLAGELNIGGNFLDVYGNEFELLESFTTGSCKTNYNVSSRSPNDVDVKEHEDSNVIEILIGREMPPGEIKEILRTRNLDTCGYGPNDFFNSTSGIIRKTISSKSLMTLRNRDFTSFTENFIDARVKWFPAIILTNKVTERITLSLEKIVPAISPLPMIHNPSRINIFPSRVSLEFQGEK